MTAATPAQAEQIAAWAEAIHELDSRANALVEGLSDEQLNWQPPDGGWSIAQVFAHLAATNDLYLKQIRAVLERTSGSGVARGLGDWRPSFAARMIARSFRSRRRFPSPRAFRPAIRGFSRSESVDEFLRTERELQVELNRAASLDLRRTSARSPVSPLIRLNLGDCFDLLVIHTERHLGQVERIRAKPAFPD